ncbi:hypothetical protein [Paraburkholderia diazotrophica]|uniref:Uncharacterized protein n=1 Tax=Paraburkholderia diazotrophica TaxID=667676 RepID=A0A1H7C9D0_9BURK|nr:hypothetical protein [Paraburkholderia diazotrophica]SEJ82255.1 hypothetical protein SAMN05192539_1019102 [Paraburkholderia diazotrophica]
MHHLPDPRRHCVSEDPYEQLVQQLQRDALMQGGLALLPPVLLLALLHVHSHVGWDACYTALRQLNDDHGRHMRELGTALSLLKSLRGSRILDPLAWHAAMRRLMHDIGSRLHPSPSMRMRAMRRAVAVRATRIDPRGFTLREPSRVAPTVSPMRTVRTPIDWQRYWLSAMTSAPSTWL